MRYINRSILALSIAVVGALLISSRAIPGSSRARGVMIYTESGGGGGSFEPSSRFTSDLPAPVQPLIFSDTTFFMIDDRLGNAIVRYRWYSPGPSEKGYQFSFLDGYSRYGNEQVRLFRIFQMKTLFDDDDNRGLFLSTDYLIRIALSEEIAVDWITHSFPQPRVHRPVPASTFQTFNSILFAAKSMEPDQTDLLLIGLNSDLKAYHYPARISWMAANNVER